VSLDSVDEIRTTRACSLSTPDTRDTIHLRLVLWNAPPAPVVSGRRPAVRASKSRNTLARCGPWQQVMRFPQSQRSRCAGSTKQWQPGYACHGSRDDELCVDEGSPTFTPDSTCERSTSPRRPFIHAIEGHRQKYSAIEMEKKRRWKKLIPRGKKFFGWLLFILFLNAIGWLLASRLR